MSRFTLGALILFGLISCTSQALKDSYYSLVLASDELSVSPVDNKILGRMIIGPVRLPAYLSRRGLALQVGSNQVETANHHFWAEPLDEGISKVLIQDLSVLLRQVTVDRDAGRWASSSNCRLRLEFDKFHATTEATVVSAGRYWLSSKELNIKWEFNMSRQLPSDGYAVSVNELRSLLAVLAEEISAHVDSESFCKDK
ncbi:MAG: PqiC family protein [Pseudomonadales bacterium]|nr:PqiC family protein [Pseudomonadales bacterium]